MDTLFVDMKRPMQKNGMGGGGREGVGGRKGGKGDEIQTFVVFV